MQQVTTLGIDVAKNVFQLHGVDERDKTVLQKKRSRTRSWRSWPSCRPV